MRRVLPHNLWMGHAGDARDLRAIRGAGILAIIDLAAAESPLIGAPNTLARDMVYCRFPICDGGGGEEPGEGNGAADERWMIRAAIDAATGLLRAGVPTLIFCGAGMSRSPGIAAAAISHVMGRSPDECLREVALGGPTDVSPALWGRVSAALGHGR